MKKVFIFSVFVLILSIPLKVFSQLEVADVNLVSNGNKLNADFYKASGGDKYPTLILLHGYPGGEGDQWVLGKKLSSSGINVLIFNFQGTWSSEGIFIWESSMQDISRAVEFLNEKDNIEIYHIDTTNIIAAGYSFGGAMALTEAIYNPEIKRIISIAGADESVEGRKCITDSTYRNALESYLRTTIYPEGPIKWGGFDTVINAWINNLDYYDQVKHAKNLVNKDLLFIGGWNDENCVVKETIIPLYRRLKELNAENIKIKVFDADHGFRNVGEELTETIHSWIMNIN
jgi:dipeptidyl aminopeptidase/acylaminoacyl peptidase